MTKQKAYIFVILGAFLWGIIGIFINQLYEYRFTAWEVVAVRVIASALLMAALLGIFRPQLLKSIGKTAFILLELELLASSFLIGATFL